MESWQDQVAAAHAEVINDIKSKFAQLNGGPSVIEGVKAFCAAVDWNVSTGEYQNYKAEKLEKFPCVPT